MPNPRPVRRSQLISPFGVGSLVDFRGDESLMTAGLDEWPFAGEECPADWLVREERLQARLQGKSFQTSPGTQGTWTGSTVRKPVHTVRPLPPMALLPTSRCHGIPATLRGTSQMPLSSGTRLQLAAGVEAPLSDSEPIHCRMPKRDILRTSHSCSGSTETATGIKHTN